MAQKKILLLTLVHPDFLPPVYATAQVLRDHGYWVDIVTFTSYVPADFDIGDKIAVHDVGQYHDKPIFQKLLLRRKYIAEARKKLSSETKLVISFCPFSFLCALKINKGVPHAYIALEIKNFRWEQFRISPLSEYRNLLTFNRLHKADIVATPSIERSAWLAGRANLVDLPYTVHNTSYYDPQIPAKQNLDHIIPPALRNKKTILYTGRLHDNYRIKELVLAFDELDKDCALVITGIREQEEYSAQILALHANLKTKHKIVLLPLVTRNEMVALQQYADIGVCFMHEHSLETKMPAPNKVGEYIANGLYLLSNDMDYMKSFKFSGVATLVNDLQPTGIAYGLNEALEKIGSGDIKTKVRNFHRDEFSMQKQLEPIVGYLNGTIK